MSFSRRDFLRYAGFGTLATLGQPLVAATAAPVALPRQKPRASSLESPFGFTPIEHSRADQLILPPSFRADMIARWGDSLGSRGSRGGETFGYNCDFNAYFPLDALQGGKSSSDGLLWTNHEYPVAMFVSRHDGKSRKTAAQIELEKDCIGGSVVRVRRENGVWKRVADTRTRRFNGFYPQIAISGPARELVPVATGTLANCSGGRTPWHTVLSCEENFQDYNKKHGWADVAAHTIDEKQYGWVVEVDPFGELPPFKHSCLGRFSHENVAWRIGPTGKMVCYMGDDSNDQFLYKFVSAESYNARQSRADARKLLQNGTLYAADFGSGKWLPIDLNRSAKLREAGFQTQAEVLVRTREAAAVLGATPLDRPEDCEVHPLDGTLYIALTNNVKHGNYYGQIVRLLEKEDNPESEGFRYEIFLAGGPQSGLACPDNLTFDSKGNLCVSTDIAGYNANRGAYDTLGNNGLFMVPTRGADAGTAYQFASAPVDAELTGHWFTEDEKTLFLSVQHPGEESDNLQNLTSHWPDGGAALPRPSVVAVTGF
ncbi:MAG TPA: alkaline phosphatase PhoX [Abditibacterium sp.]|jgi:hypothetical protein